MKEKSNGAQRHNSVLLWSAQHVSYMFHVHVGNNEESSSAMAELAMFEAAVRHVCWMDFFETWIRAIAQSIPFVRKRNQVFVPSHYERHAKQTDRQAHSQAERQQKPVEPQIDYITFGDKWL